MKKQFGLLLLLTSALAMTACSKPDTAQSESEASAVETHEQTSAEQQAAIDALDQPVLDEKNQDVAAEIADAPADSATPEIAASEPVAQ